MRPAAAGLSLNLPGGGPGRRVAEITGDAPAGHTRWSLSLMAQATGISRSHLQRWWSAAQVQPHRRRSFKRSNDPEFEAKLRDVVDLYQKKEAG